MLQFTIRDLLKVKAQCHHIHTMLKKEVHSPLAGWSPIFGSSLVSIAAGASLLSNEKQTICDPV